MKKLLSLIVALFAVLPVFAYDFEVNGIYYNKLYNNTVAVSYNIYSWDVTIPETVTYNGTTYSVTEIGYRAFFYCSRLTSVSIPNSVTKIGESAFYGCSGLTSIDIDSENTVYSSVDGVVYSKDMKILCICPGGKQGSFDIPNSVTKIGEYAFSYCYGLTSVSIGNSVKTIGAYAFEVCSGLTSVSIGNSVTSIGEYAFYNCSGLTSIDIDSENTVYSSVDGVVYSKDMKVLFICPEGKQGSFDIPNSVTEIGERAFYDCRGLTSVTIPNSVTSIGESAFYDCSGLTSVSIGNSVTEISDYCFYKCSGLTSVSIPNSVSYIGSSAFSNCSGLTSVSIPNSVTSISSSCFSGCSGLTSVSIPNSVTEIGEYAFYDCTGLTSLYIGEKVSEIGYRAFSGCKLIEEIVVAAIVTPTAYESSFEPFTYTFANLYVPERTINSYKALMPWSKFLTIKTLDESGVNAVSENSGAVFDICSVNGVLLKRGATQADIDALAPGLYIAGGKKLLVK